VDVLERSKEAPNGVMPLITEMGYLESAVRNLADMLQTTTDYVAGVVGGSIPMDNRVGRHLLDVVQSVPVVDAATIDKLYNGSFQDLLMVTYLTNLTRTQMAMAEKLATSL
jgi:translation initiation factor 3 subunit F